MRTPARLFLLALLFVSLSGCLVGKDHVTLTKDGSGTIRSTYVVDLETAETLVKTAKELFGDGLGIPEKLANPFGKPWLEHVAKDVKGYEITKTAEVTSEKERTNTVEAKFTSLEEAAKGGAFFSSAVTLSKTEEGHWKLTLLDTLVASGDDTQGIDPSAILPIFEAQLKGLDIRRALTLPTKIVETNGTQAEDGMSVEWAVDFNKILSGKDLQMTVVFEAAEDLKLEAFAYAPDRMAIAQRFMEEAPKLEAEAAKEDGGEGEKEDDDEDAEDADDEDEDEDDPMGDGGR